MLNYMTVHILIPHLAFTVHIVVDEFTYVNISISPIIFAVEHSIIIPRAFKIISTSLKLHKTLSLLFVLEIFPFVFVTVAIQLAAHALTLAAQKLPDIDISISPP